MRTSIVKPSFFDAGAWQLTMETGSLSSPTRTRKCWKHRSAWSGNEVADELALKDFHSIRHHDRRVVPGSVHTGRRSRSVRKQFSNPGIDVASWDVFVEIAEAKYVQRMNSECLGKV